MFNTESIQNRLREKPFRPVRIIVSEGQQIDIYHPDLVWVGHRDVMIGFPGPDNPTVYDLVTRVAMVHIVSLEDIPVTTAPGNGQG